MTQAIFHPASVATTDSGFQAPFGLRLPDTTTARSPVESSANSTPFVPLSEPADDLDALTIFMLPRADFDPRGWAVHLKMLAKPRSSVRNALAEVKKELRAPTRSPRAKATRPAKVAPAVVAGACA